MTDEKRRESALKWFDIIYKETQQIIIHQHVFWEVQEIIKSNDRLRETPSVFFQWMGQSFTASAAAAVRRQADNRKDVISLRRLLMELKAHPQLFSREYFRSLYPDTFPRDLIEHDYDRVAGPGMDVLDKMRIQADIDLLVEKTEGIKHYVDNRVAHYSVTGIARPNPTFNDLADCLDTFEKLVKRYYLTMKAVSVSQLLPTFQYEWKAIFEMAWMTAQERPDIEEQ